MGGRMARRLLDAGHHVTGYNRTRARAQWLVDMGLELVDTPRMVAEASEVTFSMMANDDALLAVALGNDGCAGWNGAGQGVCGHEHRQPSVSRSWRPKPPNGVP